MTKDPYAVLGVSRTATHDEIVRAYRSLASKWHPDRNPGNVEEASAKFKEISAAFEVVGDETKRKNYDFYGSPSTFSFRSRNSVDDMFDNMFSRVFGDQVRDRTRVKITMAESYLGCVRTVSHEKKGPCDGCRGTGSSRWQPCTKCDAKGFVFTSNGPFRIQASCAQCGGRGSVSLEGCKACGGRGYSVLSSSNVEVHIPPGVDDGNQIKVSADGDEFFVMVNVEKSRNFQRVNRDLFSRIEVPYSRLMLGGESEFDLFGKKISVKIRPMTGSGTRIRIKGQGMPSPHNPEARGDLFLEMALKMPEKITDDLRRVLTDLSKLEQSD